MRSDKINPLFSPIISLSGIGPKLDVLFQRLVGPRLVHLLWHLPYNIIKRKFINKIIEAELNTLVTFKVHIIKHNPSHFNRKAPYKISCMCGDTPISLVFFYARQPYLKSMLPERESRFISGKLEYFNNTYQVTHPSHIIEINKLDKLKNIEPVYGLTAGLTNNIYNKTIEKVLKNIPDLEEWIDEKIIQKYSFNNWKNSLIKSHQPKTKEDLVESNINRKRLAYDELLAHQLAIAIIRNYNQKTKGIKFKKNPNLVVKCINNLPFKLTQSQEYVWREIFEDLNSQHQMIRLLQGDTGSGKTVIALLSLMHAIDSNYQGALMAPTSILAQQHFNNLSKILKNLKINIVLLTGKDTGKSRLQKLSLIKSGKAQIIIGTHALIQEDVSYHSIGLVVCDESHRFGVFQRLAFTNKGLKPNVLTMSGTPIPRTLALAAYGNIDQSRLTEKPEGRLPVVTKSLPIIKVNELVDRLYKKIESKEKIYWVCSLVQESEELDLQAATKRFEFLKTKFKGKVLLIHGQLKEKEKEDVMNKFQNDNYSILVATTVIEVGVDVPLATTMIIENAERFGLSTLHQIRGRIGRNNLPANCILLFKKNIGEMAKKRIAKMKETNDGFEIAEHDYLLRGEGDRIGKKQSGQPTFLIADLAFDKDLLEDARKTVDYISQNDPKLKNENGLRLRNLLHLFEKDVAIKTLLAG